MDSEEILLNAAFYVFALLGIVTAVAVALSSNIVRSAFALLGVLLSVAAVYAFMRADFVVAAQIIIYVGGILVLIMFAVMLTHKITDVNVSNESAPGPAAVFAVLCVLFALVVVIGTWTWDRTPGIQRAADTRVVAGGAEPSRAVVELALYQPATGGTGGRTGIAPGGPVMGAFVEVRCAVVARPAAATSALVTFENAERGRDGTLGPWQPAGTCDIAHFDSARPGAGEGRARLDHLKPGRVRWSARFFAGGEPLAHALFLCAQPDCPSRGQPGDRCGREGCAQAGQALVPLFTCGEPACKSRGKAGDKCASKPCKAAGKDLVPAPLPPALACREAGCPSLGVLETQRCARSGCAREGKALTPRPWDIDGGGFEVEAGLTRPLGMALMSRHLLPFEVVSVLLLAALIGASFLARKEVK
jgi:NADH:ubiquinone oxidoreductase subunit 6 (subunit J)